MAGTSIRTDEAARHMDAAAGPMRTRGIHTEARLIPMGETWNYRALRRNGIDAADCLKE